MADQVIPLTPMKSMPAKAPYKKGDVLVVFGELFSRGYANGIVDEADRAGMTVVRSTVGRRTSDGNLRDLNPEEMATHPQPFINVALEAGFDLEPDPITGQTPNSFFEGTKLSEWQNAKADFEVINRCRRAGENRFRNSVRKYLTELKKYIGPEANIIFCHTMAGGVPRAKIIMPVMNRIFKGIGDRHVPSDDLFHSDLGRFALMNFEEVTANTLKILIEETKEIRDEREKKNLKVSYLAYGYHGTEVLIRGNYQWQTYTPYFQGWAKRHLEQVAIQQSQKNVKVCVYNCPEILTNSSSIFQGVEVSLYPLLGALNEHRSAKTQAVIEQCRALLKPEFTLDSLLRTTDAYMESDLILRHSVFDKWPQNNSRDQMEKMLKLSDELFNLNKDPKSPITSVLSEQVFRATGYLMFNDAWNPQRPVSWLGHDILALALASGHTL